MMFYPRSEQARALKSLDVDQVLAYFPFRDAALYCSLSEARTQVRAFVLQQDLGRNFIAYLDEFGHAGHMARTDPKYRE